MKRNRISYSLLFLLTIALGLLSRRLNYLLPNSINLILGDAIWAMMIFVGLGVIFNQYSTIRVAIISIVFCYAIELSQLYHAPWIDAIRNTTLGALVLGFGFLWSDVLAYSIGIIFVASLEFLFKKNQN
jgi:hypothetical protein